MTPRYATPAFVELRDEFKAAGFSLFFNRDTEVFEVRRGRALVWACPTLTGARRWFRWSGNRTSVKAASASRKG